MITVDGIMDRISSIDKVIICILGYGNIGRHGTSFSEKKKSPKKHKKGGHIT